MKCQGPPYELETIGTAIAKKIYTPITKTLCEGGHFERVKPSFRILLVSCVKIV